MLCTILLLLSLYHILRIFQYFYSFFLTYFLYFYKISLKELLNYNIEPLSIIGLLGSQLRIIYQVKILSKNRLSDQEIAKQLEEKSDYRIKKTRELIPLYTEEELLKLMQKLSDIDYQLKTTDKDPNLEIENFIINM